MQFLSKALSDLEWLAWESRRRENLIVINLSIKTNFPCAKMRTEEKQTIMTIPKF